MTNNLATLNAPNEITFLADTKTHKNRFEIPSSSGDEVYIVSQAVRNDEWQCGCKGWIFKKPGRPRGCKHLTALMPVLAQIGGSTSAPTQVAAAPKQVTSIKAAPAPAKVATSGRNAARDAVETLVRQAEREAADARAKADQADAKLAALRAAMNAA